MWYSGSFHQMVVHGLVTGENLGMEYMDEVGEDDLRFHGHILVEGHFLHVAINDAVILPGIEIGVAIVLLL